MGEGEGEGMLGVLCAVRPPGCCLWPVPNAGGAACLRLDRSSSFPVLHLAAGPGLGENFYFLLSAFPGFNSRQFS